jgi:hypothetical protein
VQTSSDPRRHGLTSVLFYALPIVLVGAGAVFYFGGGEQKAESSSADGRLVRSSGIQAMGDGPLFLALASEGFVRASRPIVGIIEEQHYVCPPL